MRKKRRYTFPTYGAVAALTTDDIQGWSPRQITGKLPNLRVVGFGKLNCPNGEVAMKKLE